jgi:hypothetical protein
VKSHSAKPAIFVVLVLVLSSPTLRDILAGSVTATSAAAHLGLAIMVAWAAVSLLSAVISNYAAVSAARERQLAEEARAAQSEAETTLP